MKANILVNDLERAVITDFGMSFIRTDKTLADVVISREIHGSTTRWCAPELFDDDARASMASDIWALGCVLYQVRYIQLDLR
jgi:serine/threonine protein kinase